MNAKFDRRGNPTTMLAITYASLFLLTLWAAYTGHLPTHLLDQIPYYDKVGHVVLYCIASYLGHQVLRRRHYQQAGIGWPIFPCLFGLFTITEEIVQGFSPYRTLDGVDLICSGCGILLGYGLAQWSARSR